MPTLNPNMTVTSGLQDPRFIRMGWMTIPRELPTDRDHIKVRQHTLPNDMLKNNDVRVGRFILHKDLWGDSEGEGEGEGE